MNGFGQRVRALREKTKMTQEELAEKIGLPSTAVSKIENGTQAVKIHQAETIACALGVDIVVLLGAVPVHPYFEALYHALQCRPPEARKDCADLLRILADNIMALPMR